MRSKALIKAETNLQRDPRLSETWRKIDWAAIEKLPVFADATKQIAIVSYPDDEGVRINNGRAGAADGPEKILHYLGRMVHRGGETPPLLIVSDHLRQAYLEQRHQAAESRVQHLLKLNCRVITLGGGHDYGYPDSAAYHRLFKGKILNIDAHLDVRPVIAGRLNSGTPFYRFIKEFGGKHLIEWGIQNHCNAVSHLEFAKMAGTKILDAGKKLPKIHGPVGLSICLDAFQGIRGVSAPAMAGLSTQQGLEAVRMYGSRSKWLGLYECAPKYDPLNEDSARFAALLAYHFIHS